MRHLDANALAQLIGAMADVITGIAAPAARPSTRLPSPLATALDDFATAWRPAPRPAAAMLEARIERLAAAGMAFIEGDPMTAAQLMDAPVDPAGVPAPGPVAEPSLAARIEAFGAVAASAQAAAGDLTGRQLARRAFHGSDHCIAAFRSVSSSHRAVAEALARFHVVSDAADERRRIVQELLGDVPAGAPGGDDGAHIARLRDKAITVDDEAVASAGRCAAEIRSAIPAPPELVAAHLGIEHALVAVRGMLMEAVALERGAASSPWPAESRTVA
jgi:hypothetical protein